MEKYAYAQKIKDVWVKDLPFLKMYIIKFSAVRATEICHPFDGCVDVHIGSLKKYCSMSMR